MALFKAKPQQEEKPEFNWAMERQALVQEMQSGLQAALSPIMTALSALGQQRQIQQSDDEENDQPQQRPQMSEAQFRQMIRDEFKQQTPEVTNKYVPKSRMQAARQFRNSLTAEGREMYDKYSDEVEAVMDRVAEDQQANPLAFEQAFKFAMITQHEQEYLKAMLVDAKPEDLPPHLQQPVGQGAQADPATQLSKDEEVLQPIFDRTFKGGFTPKQMKDFGELEFESMDQMIAKAREKGLIANGAATAAKTD